LPSRDGVLDDLAVLSLAIPKLIKEVDKFFFGKPTKYNSGTKIIDAEIVK
jgi:hypothetical protein